MASTFNAKLDTTTGVFSVVEANMFKQLTHIQLQLRAGDDAAIKMYLASRLALTLATAKKQAKELDFAYSKIRTTEQNTEEMTRELSNLRFVCSFVDAFVPS